MSVALDTNVIVDVVGGTQETASRVLAALQAHGASSTFVISPVVYAELFAHPGWQPNDVLEFLQATAIAIDWDLPEAVWTRAGEAFASHARRRRKTKAHAGTRRLLADFVVGSHALQIGALMTSDADFYRRNFPDLRVIGV